MITKFEIFERSENSLFESNNNKKWFYHATKSEYLPEIVKHGLLPNIDRESNFGGSLEEESRGKVYVTKNLYNAKYYSKFINGDNDVYYRPILRIKNISETKLKPDLRSEFNDELYYGAHTIEEMKDAPDLYSEEPITGEFEIIDGGGRKWRKLTLDLAEKIADGLWNGEEIIFESNNNKKWFYHATKSEYLPEIVEHGLTPNIDRETNWKGEFEKWSRGKVFVTENFATAEFYGEEICKNDPNYDPYCIKFIPILRIWLDSKKLTKDHSEEYDWYSTKPITGEFEIYNDRVDEWIEFDEYLAHDMAQGYWDVYKNDKVEEGLISTTPTKKTVKIFKRRFPDYYFEILSDGEIEISAGRKDYVEEIKAIDNLSKTLGWYISYGNKINTNYEDNIQIIKYDDDKFFDHKYEQINIKQIFDTTRDIDLKPSLLYHVTPVKNVEKILKIGLVPKHKDKLSHHPDRVYITDELEFAWGLKKQFERLNRIECEILKISTKGLDIKLYSDVDSRPNGFYTLDNIPPKYISILPKEEYRKHWKGILESKKENNIFVRFGGLSKVRYDELLLH